MRHVLIIGSGFIGQRLGRALRDAGLEVTLSSRHWPPGLGQEPWRCLDATRPGAIAEAVGATGAHAVVLVHGPSDITGCESAPEAAMATHAGIAARLCQEAPSVRKVLISTDNVFDGQDTSYDESRSPNPANAYGRAKLAAEHVLLSADPGALVVRTSLVYGYEPQGPGRGWRNFFMVVAEAVRAGQPVQAPVDHWNTPILVDDAAAVLARLIPGRQAGLLHLAGPDRASRFEWGQLIARSLGQDPGLVRPVERAAGRYSCRPTNACLRSLRLHQLPELSGLSISGLAAGAARLGPLLDVPPPPASIEEVIP
ncbi:dTDP-4-dehydrorhamnose reductase [Cystobacter fuscus DSM 2262]|uniref:dTDP-4-dehydrorhamnose reductase n=1 Tax=Cystobacter fuscus (strain ATCC 25194 / DSM 2262 / NBRC 100088 / M29) TaxID=1242864 RepID=S9P049_CYSF2|nr:sugar nucleotide-binding protein [Cystobacter fuscus]EPX56496.1 dTDP-4-dehydrorhamnose reductase [Cystobacter fuscus DSM 2262]